jgi:hypothetical protein
MKFTKLCTQIAVLKINLEETSGSVLKSSEHELFNTLNIFLVTIFEVGNIAQKVC